LQPLIDLADISLKLGKRDGKTTVFDPVRKKWFILTPEEYVRQCLLQYMLEVAAYPIALIAVEKTIQVGNMTKRFDVVVYNRDHKPWLLAECKAPEVPISQATMRQLLNYQRTMQCNYWLLTNGHEVYCADACDVTNIQWLSSLPIYNT
jgi:hypothetical protein